MSKTNYMKKNNNDKRRRDMVVGKAAAHLCLTLIIKELKFSVEHDRVRETFELNQLKSAPSQLLPVFSEFDRFQACCH
jgi:hypothetical protein